MRLFVACEVPEDVRSMLSSLRSTFDAAAARMKWVEEENIHVTMKFLGEVSEQSLDCIMDALGRVAFEPFSVRVGGIGAFPDRSRPRVLWAGIEPEGGMMKLHDGIDSSLAECGFGHERRFSPHATIARVRQVTDGEAFARSLDALRAESPEFTVKGFVLKRSTLTPAGPVYEDIAAFPKDKSMLGE